jgi:toxin FitB
MFLLDTVVLSELGKPPRRRNSNLIYWIETVSSQDLFVSVVTIGEIERGIERQRGLNPQFEPRGMARPSPAHLCGPNSAN